MEISGGAIRELFSPSGGNLASFSAGDWNSLLTGAALGAAVISVIMDNAFPGVVLLRVVVCAAGLLCCLPLATGGYGPDIGGGLLWLTGVPLVISGPCSMVRSLVEDRVAGG